MYPLSGYTLFHCPRTMKSTLALTFKGSTFGLSALTGTGTIHSNRIGVALAALIVNTIFGFAADRHRHIDIVIADRVGCTLRDRRKGLTAGIAAIRSVGSADMDFRTAAAIILVARAMDDITFQIGHFSLTPLIKLGSVLIMGKRTVNYV